MKFSKVILQKYLFYDKDLQKDGNTLLLHLYDSFRLNSKESVKS